MFGFSISINIKFSGEILAKEKTTSDELIKRLVKERWLS